MHTHAPLQVSGLPMRWICEGCGRLARIHGALGGLACPRSPSWPKTARALFQAGALDEGLATIGGEQAPSHPGRVGTPWRGQPDPATRC